VANRVQTIRYYTTLQRPPTTEFSGELYINYADIQIGALDTSHSPVDFVAVRYYSQLAMYVAGDFTVYNGSLYRCLQNGTTGPFDSTRWSYFANSQEVSVLITVETQRAEAAEQHLQNEIDAEITARQAGDTNLQNEINSLTTALGNVFPPGVSLDYYGVNAPAGWLLENGATYAVNTYPALGALLGGSPGGTFTVPNSIGRFGVTVGPGFPLMSTGGSTTATLNTTNLPSHTHTIQPHIHTGSVAPHHHTVSWGLATNAATSLLGGFAAGLWPVGNQTDDASPTINVNPSSVLTTDPAGSGAPITTLPPYISRTRIIKT
jgi:microcystin-dependent protein